MIQGHSEERAFLGASCKKKVFRKKVLKTKVFLDF